MLNYTRIIWDISIWFAPLHLTLNFQQSFQSVCHFTACATNSAWCRRKICRSCCFDPMHWRFRQDFWRWSFTEFGTCINRRRRRLRHRSACFRRFKKSALLWRRTKRTIRHATAAFFTTWSFMWCSLVTAVTLWFVKTQTSCQQNETIIPNYNFPVAAGDGFRIEIRRRHCSILVAVEQWRFRRSSAATTVDQWIISHSSCTVLFRYCFSFHVGRRFWHIQAEDQLRLHTN